MFKHHVLIGNFHNDLLKDGDKEASQWLRLAGHCFYHPELPANKVLLWEPLHGRKRREGLSSQMQELQTPTS